MMRHHSERREPNGNRVSWFSDYDVLINAASNQDGELVIWDPSRPLLNEAYNEVLQGCKGNQPRRRKNANQYQELYAKPVHDWSFF